MPIEAPGMTAPRPDSSTTAEATHRVADSWTSISSTNNTMVRQLPTGKVRDVVASVIMAALSKRAPTKQGESRGNHKVETTHAG
jgi:hypothetical protein